MTGSRRGRDHRAAATARIDVRQPRRRLVVARR
jgi:hypothetical protein